MKRLAYGAAAALCVALPISSASAQITVDEIERRFDEDREPLSQPGPLIPEFDPLTPPAEAEGITFELGGINLVGNTILGDSDLAPLFTDLIGTTISVEQLFEIANQITALYGQAGYPLSRALVPAQEIDPSGQVTIRIVEGFVDEVIIESELPPNPD